MGRDVFKVETAKGNGKIKAAEMFFFLLPSVVCIFLSFFPTFKY